jgi:hypothetical protein
MTLHIDGNVQSIGDIQIPQSMLFGALQHIRQEMGGRLDSATISEFHARLDSEAIGRHVDAGGRLPPELVDLWHQDCAERGIRLDAAPFGGGGVTAFPNELEFMRVRELEQIKAPRNAVRLFPADRTVPIGAQEHGWFRRIGRGEAVVTRGDTQNYGHAQTGRVKETRPVIYVVCSVRQTYFEMLATDYAGIPQYAADLRQAYDLVDERINDILWQGFGPALVFGALNHPQLLKMVLNVIIGGSAPSSPQAIAAAIQQMLDYPAHLSGDSMQPTILVVSPRVYRYLAQTQYAAGQNTTILQWILQGQDSTNGIREIRKAQELTAIGPNGEDGLLAFREDVDALANVEVMPTRTMPVYQATALSWLTLVVAATAGVAMPNVGHNILGLVRAP